MLVLTQWYLGVLIGIELGVCQTKEHMQTDRRELSASRAGQEKPALLGTLILTASLQNYVENTPLLFKSPSVEYFVRASFTN